MLRVKSGFPGRINHITLLVFTYGIINLIDYQMHQDHRVKCHGMYFLQ